MGFVKEMRKGVRAAGRVGKRLPTTAEIVYGKKPRAKRRK